ncbi:MAG: efflux RND transporter permease subunit [Thermoguttaceae bacterium]|jgi:CzcA family heavy metal efflux pump
MNHTTSEPASPAVSPGRRNLVALARPLFGLILLASVVLLVFGFTAMLRMPRGIYPEVAFPRISIIAQTPGLAVKTVEISVTRPIEEAVGVVLGVHWVRSKTLRGAAQVDIGFSPGTDMVQALNDVRAKVAEIRSQLPAGTATLIERQTPSIFPIISFVVTGGRDLSALREYAYYDLRPRIARLEDVSYVAVRGGDVREIAVEVEPARLAAAGLSIAEVADRLGKAHRLGAVGRMDRGRLQYQVLVDSQVGDPRDLEDVVLAAPGGRPIRIGDLGRVVLAHEDRTVAVSANGRDAVSLTVFRRLGGDALAVSEEVDRVLAEARKVAPSGVQITPVYDQGLLVRTSIANVRDAILVGGALSVLVLLAFLKSLRATILTALSIPLSLVISFLFLHLTGDSLNLMSLGGLAVAIGLIIDDSVVVIENIARHLAEGQTGDAAVDRASREISGAVIGSTLTTILVFVPLAFVRGVIGQFFQSLSLALAIAILVSMVVSLTLIPVLAARLVGRRGMPASGPIYAALAGGYERLLRLGLRFPRTVVLAALLAVVPGWWIFQHLKIGFMPAMDEGAFVLDFFLPSGTSLAETDRVARGIDRVLSDTPDVAGYLRETGAENGLYATEVFRGDILVSLKPAGRRRPAEEISDDLRKELKDKVPAAKIDIHPLIEDQINDLNGVTSPIEVKIFGPDAATLRRLATEVGKIVEETGAKDVDTHVREGSPELVVRPDSAVPATSLTAQDVQDQLTAALYGQVVGALPQQERMVNIRVRYPDRVRFDRPGLADLPIELPEAVDTAKAGAAPPAGGAVPPRFVLLGQVAGIELVRSPSESWRENQQPYISVSAELGRQDLGTLYRKLQAALPKLDMPSGYRWELAGNFRAQQESFASLLAVLLSASALVFLLLGFQFRSLTLPLLIFLAQPVSLASALAALWITGTPLNVASFMGAILLIGLDVKNGIILIEYIGQLRAAGLPLEEALVRAGRTRFRPILMTGLTTIFGLLPLAFGFGPGAQMQQPLAIAVIGGLVVNTLLTRLLIPVGYLALRRGNTACG